MLTTLRKPRPILSDWKKFVKKEELNLKKIKVKIFNFLCEIATNCKLLITKTSILSDHENVVFILIYKILQII